MSRTCAGAALIGALVVACAPVSPSPSAPALDVATGSALALRDARTFWVERALSYTGDTASGGDAARSASGDAPGDVSEAVKRALARAPVELAPSRDRADLLIYFEQADRLRCWACRQPEGLWYWWAIVGDTSGRVLLSLHGETGRGRDAASEDFAAEMRALLRDARRTARGT
jgi:hypothetical protein